MITVAAEHVDAVVVGSGFGGSVVAHRLAEAGRSVLLLERGKAYPPGSFPRSPRDMGRNFWDPSAGLHGMFDLWTFRGLEAIVASGLGGGSLIYANVLLRKDERWFVHDDPDGHEHWPVTRADLEPHYDAVERMLETQRYPLHAEPYASTPKTNATLAAARRLDLDWQLPPLAVTFANRGEWPEPGVPIREQEPNLHGAARSTCRLCGECDVGCNFGSKNTLDLTYLSAFARLPGAQLRTRAEVRRFGPRDGGGYWVDYVHHDPDREGAETTTSALPLRRVTADKLVLAAGTLGSPYLLLRNRDALPGLSRALGSRFSGNGDLLGFVRPRRGRARTPGPFDPSTGPVITSALRYPDGHDGPGYAGKRGFYVEDGGYPEFVGWMLESVNVPGQLRRAATFGWRWLRNRLAEKPVSSLSADIGALLGDGSRSSTVLPMLAMGRDVPDGVLSLRGRYLDVDWTIDTSRAYFEGVRGAMADVARALDGELVVNPLWYLRRVVTVHPLGGCPMGRNAAEGVVDAHGEVYGHPGLFVADGSVMPGPVGPNPSLTIAALADRFAERMLEPRTP